MAKAKAKGAPSMILQHAPQAALEITGRNVLRGQQPTRYTDANLREWTAATLGRDVSLKLRERIILSAARTRVADKAWLNAISCRHVFAEMPAIEFLNDRSNYFGGRLEFWLENLSGARILQFTIRMTGYSQGGATITIGASFPTVLSLVPLQVNGSMNFTLGNTLQVPANPPGGLGLVTLDVQFYNAQSGSWQFIDVVFTEVT